MEYQLSPLIELECLAGDLRTVDEFEQAYEALLETASITHDQAMLKAMKRILLTQAQYLMNYWLKEKQLQEPLQVFMQLGRESLN